MNETMNYSKLAKMGKHHWACVRFCPGTQGWPVSQACSIRHPYFTWLVGGFSPFLCLFWLVITVVWLMPARNAPGPWWSWWLFEETLEKICEFRMGGWLLIWEETPWWYLVVHPTNRKWLITRVISGRLAPTDPIEITRVGYNPLTIRWTDRPFGILPMCVDHVPNLRIAQLC